MTYLKLPESLEFDSAFKRCSAIKKIEYTKGIGFSVFSYTDSTNSSNSDSFKHSPGYIARGSLTEVVFAEGVTVVPPNVFRQCALLEKITLPSTLTVIGGGAFYSCSKLATVDIPGSVTRILASAFDGCTSLANCHFLGEKTQYDSITIGTKNTCLTNVIHTYSDKATVGYKAATCIEIGFTGDVVCSKCDRVYSKGTEIPLTDHTEIAVFGKDATCTESGLTDGSKCEVCEAEIVKQVEIPAKGHKEVIDEKKEATCTEAGITQESHCDECGETLVAQKAVDALGHDLTNYKAQAATCTKSGWAAYSTCSRCDYNTYKEVKALGHKLVKTASVAATTSKTGNTEYWTCSVCGLYFADEKGTKEIQKDSWILPVLPVQNFTLVKTSLEAGLLKYTDLGVTLSSPAANKNVKWTSADTSIATVDTNGQLYGVKRGTTTLTAVRKDNGKSLGTVTVTITFNDIITLSKGFKNAINWLADRGVVNGMSDGSFGQDNTCTRKQFAIMLYRYAGKPAISGSMKFNDCPYGAKSDSYKAIVWASQKGIVKGYDDGTFRPDNTVTRQQVLIMLYRFAGKPAVSGDMPFVDVKAGKNSDTYKAILWGSRKGITSGTSATTFSSNDGCKRRQIALFLYRYAK